MRTMAGAEVSAGSGGGPGAAQAAPAALAALESALDRLAAADPAGLDDAALIGRLRRLTVLGNRMQALISRDVAAVHRRGACVTDGFASTQALLRRRLRLTAREASRQVRVATRLAALPDTAAAFAAGEVSFDHAAAVAQACDEAGPEAVAGGAEKLLLERAREVSAGQVLRLGRWLADSLDSGSAEERQARLFRRRWLDVATTFGGAVSVQGVLDPVTGTLLRAALDAFAASPDRAEGAEAAGDAVRSPGQRRADALGDLCRAAMDASAGGTGQQRPQVTVTVPWETLRGAAGSPRPGNGGAESSASTRSAAGPHGRSPAGDTEAVALLGLEPVSAETARRVACDAGVIPAVLGSAAEPLDIGRLTRTVPTGMRRALHLRDHGCRFPGCDQRGDRCDAHHLKHWSRGGPTSMENLILVCPFHHWLIHEGRWRVDYHPGSNTLTATRPDGRPYDLISGPRGPAP